MSKQGWTPKPTSDSKDFQTSIFCNRTAILASFFPFRTSIHSQQLSETPVSCFFKSNKRDAPAIFRSILDLKSSHLVILMSVIVMWHNLSCKWEADDDIRKPLRELGAHGLLGGG